MSLSRCTFKSSTYEKLIKKLKKKKKKSTALSWELTLPFFFFFSPRENQPPIVYLFVFFKAKSNKQKKKRIVAWCNCSPPCVLSCSPFFFLSLSFFYTPTMSRHRFVRNLVHGIKCFVLNFIFFWLLLSFLLRE